MHQTHITKASELLRKYLEGRALKAALARDLGVRQDLVGRWVKGERKPTPIMRARIQERFTDIGWQLWDVPAAEPGGASANATKREVA